MQIADRFLRRVAVGVRRLAAIQHLLDKSVPQVSRRWIATLAVGCAFLLRVDFVQGFYIVTYALGIYMLDLLVGFLSPQVHPELQDLADGGGPSLPTRGSDEFRPFVRRLPEFKRWRKMELCVLGILTSSGRIRLATKKRKNATAAVSYTVATSYGDKNMVKLLLHKGANKDVRNKYGKTAYDLAVEHGHTKLFDALKLGDRLCTAARKGEAQQIH
ncbi:hypothetical protein NL676_013611 [Syzygium grande]|nr:hypothetical protein NL676_013611 [Syzygium grande]